MLKINDFGSVEFIKSITDQKQIPEPHLTEVAFAGRSNVGKSSLLNAIFNKKNLVKISSTPGKTQLINYFSVKDIFYCVDLPGYGYAKVPKSEKRKWQAMIEGYLVDNSNLKNIYLLIDSRHKLMNIDKEMIDWLSFSDLRFKIILSKMDKLKKNERNKVLSYFQNIFVGITIIPFSVKEKNSIQMLREDIIATV